MKKVIAVVAIAMIFVMMISSACMVDTRETMTYSEFVQEFRQGNVRELTIPQGSLEAIVIIEGRDSVVVVDIPSVLAFAEDLNEYLVEQLSEGTLRLDTPLSFYPPWWVSLLPAIVLMVVGIFTAGFVVLIIWLIIKRRK